MQIWTAHDRITTQTEEAEHFNAISKLAGTAHMKPRFNMHSYLADHIATLSVRARVCVHDSVLRNCIQILIAIL